ncbi:hypothetical protein ACJIZ3_023763 [Penstemon smallii]|uniref:Uncharacterized protein n=1 Tax=Penstemon smallii TaxID=265156 RepID=A0ABD3TQY8_9LAMI
MNYSVVSFTIKYISDHRIITRFPTIFFLQYMFGSSLVTLTSMASLFKSEKSFEILKDLRPPMISFDLNIKKRPSYYTLSC